MKKKKKTETILYSHHDFIGGTGEPKNNNPKYIEYRKKWEELPSKKEVSEFPLHLDIEITNACNLRCPMCFRRVMKDEEGFMDFDLYKKLVDEGEKYGLSSINLAWRGEPLLHPKIFDMIQYAKEHGVVEIRINTNGTLLNEDRIKKLIKSGIDKVIFSVDGVTKDTYNRIRIGADFDKVIENIKEVIRVRGSMKRKWPSIEVQIMDLKQTRKEVDKFISTWKNLANRVVVCAYRNPFGEEKDDFRVEQPYTKKFPCVQLWQRLAIIWNGRTYMCCGDNVGSVVLGNAKKDRLYDIWHGGKLNRIRALHKNYEFNKIPACKICEFNEYPETKKKWG